MIMPVEVRRLTDHDFPSIEKQGQLFIEQVKIAQEHVGINKVNIGMRDWGMKVTTFISDNGDFTDVREETILIKDENQSSSRVIVPFMARFSNPFTSNWNSGRPDSKHTLDHYQTWLVIILQ